MQKLLASINDLCNPLSNERIRSLPPLPQPRDRVVYPVVNKPYMKLPITRLSFDANARRSRSVKGRLSEPQSYRKAWSRPKTPYESKSQSRDSPRTHVTNHFDANELLEKLKISFESSKHSKLLSVRAKPMRRRYVFNQVSKIRAKELLR